MTVRLTVAAVLALAVGGCDVETSEDRHERRMRQMDEDMHASSVLHQATMWRGRECRDADLYMACTQAGRCRIDCGERGEVVLDCYDEPSRVGCLPVATPTPTPASTLTYGDIEDVVVDSAADSAICVPACATPAAKGEPCLRCCALDADGDWQPWPARAEAEPTP